VKKSHEFRLKELSFFNQSEGSQANQGVESIRAAVKLETETRGSPLLKPDYLEEEQRMSATETYPLGDFLYGTDETKVKSI